MPVSIAWELFLFTNKYLNACYYVTAKDSWLLNGLYDYIILSSYSARATEVLVVVKEPHDKHYLDKYANKVLNMILKPHVDNLYVSQSSGGN